MAERTVDLRSDTTTRPTDEMREAMRTAEVGDDGFGDDPTVNRLQDLAVEKLGMEAARKLRSGIGGTMRQAGTIAAAGIIAQRPPNDLRLVLHRHITGDDVDYAITAFRSAAVAA